MLKITQRGLTKLVALFAVVFVACATMFSTNATVNAKENANTYVNAESDVTVNAKVDSGTDDTYTVTGTFQVVPKELTVTNQKDVDVVFVLDSSGSMGYGMDGAEKKAGANEKTRNEVVVENTKKLAEAIMNSNANNRVAAVDFDSTAKTLTTFTSDLTTFNNAVDRLDKTGGTYLGSGVKEAEKLISEDTNTEDRVKVIIAITDGQDDPSSNASLTLSHFKSLKDTTTIYRLIGMGFSEDKNKEGADALNNLSASVGANVNAQTHIIPLEEDILEDVLNSIHTEVSKAMIDMVNVDVTLPQSYDFVAGSLEITEENGADIQGGSAGDVHDFAFGVSSPTTGTYTYSYKVKINQAEAAKLTQKEFKTTTIQQKVTFNYTYGEEKGAVAIDEAVDLTTHKVNVSSCENSTIENTYKTTEYYVGNGASHTATWAPKDVKATLEEVVVTTYPMNKDAVVSKVDLSTLSGNAYALTDIMDCTNIYVGYEKSAPSIAPDVKDTPKDEPKKLPSVATGQNATGLIVMLVTLAGASLYLAYRLNRYRKSL
ncbi:MULTISPECIES: vWA domain-containing protein [unclassified Breznakia]|uniref:vWA domain-containing protein n=1 Tax=unclassified Breznakia TaxID=2623764 RepID=UPI002474FCB0|nr:MULTISPECIES: vWA domain-containing protein [unclassified Breznakia]MDH6366630.1 Mg-chelatase subunit ChlD [Breznakia sp. PH1-1]MDH6403723.1 Mg-chelatase subunit ChlD [Breznakia sp. PF1-11]MDH6411432.1 Mg-chelatase subunit ChlD [Breznakia sp. PFB1-11]MDH6413837.1 Mg-chelatase subunit ChlD [Breznakia sp. PFB1-14]MDH6416267.1 Mg-chelatase subunit ChlD [Breznakia sp. PFB1-4]